MDANISALLYLLSGVMFIIALRGLSSPETARQGNMLGMLGMLVAVGTTLALPDGRYFADISNISLDNTLVMAIIAVLIGGIIGGVIAVRIAMTSMPQFVAALNALGGLASVLVAWAAFLSPTAFNLPALGSLSALSLVEMSLGLVIGIVTFSGSLIAFAKLNGNMSGAPIILPLRHLVNLGLFIAIIVGTVYLCLDPANQTPQVFAIITALAFVLGFLIIIPIGGADMPVVVSMLNSYSGWAAAGIGFTLGNMGLIITGSLVGSSGAILSYIMCRGMNRSFISVILGGFGSEDGAVVAAGAKEQRPVKQGSAEDAAFIMKNASSVIIVPGYGMAVAQAQHALREMSDTLKAEGVKISYAIHPVAGRMPGHMNVLLAEANVPYDEVFELDDINNDFAQTDVVFVIGANDVTNPAARTDPQSPIFGMPILEVDKAQTVLFVKRGMGSGYAGVENELFFNDNTMMLFSDAKKMVENIVKSL
ncbi:MAG: NAD(P)(+) transhydrogenase (Re/Si-specific) subunit beta [Parvibaculales bacterium]